MATETQDMAAILKIAFEKTLKKEYGHVIPPPSYTTPTGIRHFDAIIGGGFTSSAPIAFSSTPETGKSTIAMQFCGSFLNNDPNAVAVYLDTESASNGETREVEDRITAFNIPRDRFLYMSIMMNIKDIFQSLKQLIATKSKLEESRGGEYKVLFVLDSIAAIGSSKDIDAEDVNSVIGFKARELTFELAKNKTMIAMNRVTFIIIDQVRANMQIQKNKFQPADEKGVGQFGNFKSATNVSSLQHSFRQWFWLSKGEILKPSEGFGVDGWILNIATEKNKLASSKYSIPLVFDKKYGVIPLLSEFWFLSHMTKTEKKFWVEPKKLIYPLLISVPVKLSPGTTFVLNVYNPDTGELMYSSPKIRLSKFLSTYSSDENFRGWFDYAVAVSIQKRIHEALFRSTPPETAASDEMDETETQVTSELLGGMTQEEIFPGNNEQTEETLDPNSIPEEVMEGEEDPDVSYDLE